MASTISANQLLQWRQAQLQQGGRASALDWLLDLEGGLSWQQLQQLRLRPQAPVALQVPLERLENLWLRHLHEQTPLQYLVGICPWRDLELEVQPGVLIPRQETELLVDLALEQIAAAGEPQAGWRWADLGTGSGCIAVALARAWPHSQGLAVDQSAEALVQARRNLSRYGLDSRVELLQGSWWQPLQAHWGQLQLVVANPPYIPTDVWRGLEAEVRDHEPAQALSSGADGLTAIRAIAAGALQGLAPTGRLLLEHHHDQSAAVLSLLEQAGLEAVQAHRDLEGVLRFASAQAPAQAPAQP